MNLNLVYNSFLENNLFFSLTSDELGIELKYNDKIKSF